MRHFTLTLLLLISFLSFKQEANAVTCNWKSKIVNFYTWDSCTSTKASLNGYVTLNTKGCFIYQWKVGSANVGTNSPIVNYRITQNGTYTLCVKVTDTCNKCDTTLCRTFTITCFSNCNWKKQSPGFTTWDTCKGNGLVNSLNGTVAFKSSVSCFKYAWTVNGVAVGKNRSTLNHAITANGTYVICVKVMDTCNKCDTTFCATRTISCFTSPCNWKNNTYVSFWDSCGGSAGHNSLNAYASLKSGNCYKYQWTVNNTAAGNGPLLHYNIANNGSYVVCVKITDTCNKCDTTFCSTRTITCFGSKCNWKSKVSNFYAWDTCNGSSGRNSLNAYIAFNTKGCFKYQWLINGKVPAGNGNVMHYNIFNNGTYTVCVKVTDTCNNCDTTFCSTRTINCFTSSTCNFKARTPYMYAWDTCKGTGGVNNVNAYISFQSFYCLKYVWTVNGVTKNSNYGNYSMLHYPVTANGTYVLCVKVIDTCNHCDTTICSTRTISCFNTSKCNWKSKISNFYAWDTCKGTGGRNSLNAYIAFKTTGCYKYQWKVNNAYAGNSNIMSYKITANGTYTICVKVTDTCNNCDTVICTTRTINCFSKPCNFKAKGPYFTTWDSCVGGKASVFGYISFANKACLKYQWTLAGVVAGTGPAFTAPVFKNGTYVICVKVTDTCTSNRCDTTFCYTRTVNCKGLGIGDNNFINENITVYPNPVQDVLNIDWVGDKANVEVITIIGEVVYSGELTTDKKSIETVSWSNGIYMVRVKTDAGSKIFKIVVNK